MFHSLTIGWRLLPDKDRAAESRLGFRLITPLFIACTENIIIHLRLLSVVPKSIVTFPSDQYPLNH